MIGLELTRPWMLLALVVAIPLLLDRPVRWAGLEQAPRFQALQARLRLPVAGTEPATGRTASADTSAPDRDGR